LIPNNSLQTILLPLSFIPLEELAKLFENKPIIRQIVIQEKLIMIGKANNQYKVVIIIPMDVLSPAVA
jgi:hypothetical protein